MRKGRKKKEKKTLLSLKTMRLVHHLIKQMGMAGVH
jgi:hypothetical protein